MIDLKTKRITVTGGEGFVGRHLVRRLRENRGCENVSIADLPEYDLRDLGSIRRMFDDQRPDITIHLAAVVEASWTVGKIRDDSFMITLS